MHKHITKEDRACIAALFRKNETPRQIAEVIGFHRTSVIREIRRGSDPNGHYDARRAHRRARRKRKESKTAFRILENTPEKRTLVHKHLRTRLSPEQIEGRYGVVSFMTTYRYLERHPHLKRHLRRRGRKRRRYGTKRIPSRYQANKRSIHERPPLVGLGHWEGDTIVGKGRRLSILTHVDKESGYLIADLIPQASEVVHVQVCKRMRGKPCRSITYDNGSEFALHKMIERDTKAFVYFADVGSPHQRGTNENTNGLLRDYFPKGTSFATITNQDVQRVVRALNNRPRKRLDYRTPREMFENEGVQFKC